MKIDFGRNSALFISCLALFCCGWSPADHFENFSLETQAPYSLEMRLNPEAPKDSWVESRRLADVPVDLYLREKTGGKAKLFRTVTGVYKDANRFYELRHQGLYLYRVMAGFDKSANFKAALWFYGYDGSEAQLYEFRYGSWAFMVSPDEKYIAILVNQGYSRELLIMDRGTLKGRTYSNKELGGGQINLVTWEGNKLWFADGMLLDHPVSRFYELDASKAAGFLKSYSADHMPCLDFDFNPQRKTVAYSDAPWAAVAGPDSPLAKVLEGDWKKFIEANQHVTLYEYDLVSKKRRAIDRSKSHSFRPKWLDKDRLEYDDPLGKGRMVKNVSEFSK